MFSIEGTLTELFSFIKRLILTFFTSVFKPTKFINHIINSIENTYINSSIYFFLAIIFTFISSFAERQSMGALNAYNDYFGDIKGIVFKTTLLDKILFSIPVFYFYFFLARVVITLMKFKNEEGKLYEKLIFYWSGSFIFFSIFFQSILILLSEIKYIERGLKFISILGFCLPIIYFYNYFQFSVKLFKFLTLSFFICSSIYWTDLLLRYEFLLVNNLGLSQQISLEGEYFSNDYFFRSEDINNKINISFFVQNNLESSILIKSTSITLRCDSLIYRNENKKDSIRIINKKIINLFLQFKNDSLQLQIIKPQEINKINFITYLDDLEYVQIEKSEIVYATVWVKYQINGLERIYERKVKINSYLNRKISESKILLSSKIPWKDITFDRSLYQIYYEDNLINDNVIKKINKEIYSFFRKQYAIFYNAFPETHYTFFLVNYKDRDSIPYKDTYKDKVKIIIYSDSLCKTNLSDLTLNIAFDAWNRPNEVSPMFQNISIINNPNLKKGQIYAKAKRYMKYKHTNNFLIEDYLWYYMMENSILSKSFIQYTYDQFGLKILKDICINGDKSNYLKLKSKSVLFQGWKAFMMRKIS